MAYQALYRKFRPKNFEKVYGQDHIVSTLKNQLKAGRIGHAYVFSGTRGTGKTSIAKIFAKAVNCENPTDGNPCDQCASCKRINDGSSLNVFEIDAASNTSVDNIREIIDDVSYPPAEGNRKVYIIDEVHMLSKSAFNAFLKTIEEPPEYAIFILATTEVVKIPLTILSRCQRYDFHRISVDTISKRMQELKEAENISIEDKAIRFIARQADGSMRDALSIFDQCISYYYDQDITYEMALEMLGTADTGMYSKLLRALYSRDAKTAIDLVEEAVVRGMEPESFVSDFVLYLRNILLVRNGANLEDVTDISAEDAEAFMEEVKVGDDNFLMRGIKVLSELVNEMRFSKTKRISLEIGLIRLCHPQMDTDYTALLDRIKKLEQGITITPINPIKKSVPQPVVTDYVEQEEFDEEDEFVFEEEIFESPSNVGEQIPLTEEVSDKDFISRWDRFVGTLSALDKTHIMKAVPVQKDDGSIEIYFDAKNTSGGYFKKDKSREDNIINSVVKFMGQNTEVSFKYVDENMMPQMPTKTDPTPASDDFFAGLEGTDILVDEIDDEEE